MTQYDSCLALYNPAVEIDWLGVKERLKPGSHIVSITPPLQHHTETARIEDAGVEIRDSILFLSVPPLIATLARLPIEGTVAQNVLRYGTGALNIDECRTEYVTVDGGNLALNPHLRSHINGGNGGKIIATEVERRVVIPNQKGRWPANCILGGDFDDKFPKTNKQAICKSDDKSGWQTDYVGGKVSKAVSRKLYLDGDNGGSAARFFYNVSDEDKLRGLIAYLHKLITPPGGKSMVYNLPPDAIMELRSTGSDITGYNEI